MKEKKPGGTRPEMGTPEYEEWRKEVLKRRRKRQLKERRKRLAINRNVDTRRVFIDFPLTLFAGTFLQAKILHHHM